MKTNWEIVFYVDIWAVVSTDAIFWGYMNEEEVEFLKSCFEGFKGHFLA